MTQPERHLSIYSVYLVCRNQYEIDYSLINKGLQQLVNICEDHAKETELVFSTDPNPEKSKTMCIAFKCKSPGTLASVEW